MDMIAADIRGSLRVHVLRTGEEDKLPIDSGRSSYGRHFSSGHGGGFA